MLTLVLLPGMDGTGELFTPFATALGQEFKLKIVGYPSTEALGYAKLESIVHAALPHEGSFVILGESFSGPIAISLAAAAPTQLKGLVLCCTFVRNPRPAFTRLRSLIGLLSVKLVPAWLLNHLLLGKYSTTVLRSALAQSMAQISSAALRARLRAVLSVDVSVKLEKVKVPVLYLRASQDRIVPLAASELITKFCSHSKMIELETPHFLLQAAPLDAARVVSGFMREVENSL
jgi:pimeloyl-ACP methyl ester carboxylesterase